MQAAQYSNFLNQGSLVGLAGNASPTRQPTANVFPTADGYIQITALRQPQVEKLFLELGLQDLLAQPEFENPGVRIKNPGPIHDAMCEALSEKTTQAWMDQLAPTGVPVAEVRELPEVIEDPQFEGRNTFVTLPSPVNERETITVVKAGYVTDEDGPEVTMPPPRLGAHTDGVLRELGYTLEQIGEFRKQGVT